MGREPVRVWEDRGALLAPEIAQRAAPVAGLVLLAPPARSPLQALLDQMRRLGAPPKELADATAKVQAFERGTLPREDQLFGAPQAYWRDWISRDGPGIARELRRPLLVIHGDRDYQVTGEDLAIWREGLRGVAGVRFVALPGVNHTLSVGTGKPG